VFRRGRGGHKRARPHPVGRTPGKSVRTQGASPPSGRTPKRPAQLVTPQPRRSLARIGLSFRKIHAARLVQERGPVGGVSDGDLWWLGRETVPQQGVGKARHGQETVTQHEDGLERPSYVIFPATTASTRKRCPCVPTCLQWSARRPWPFLPRQSHSCAPIRVEEPRFQLTESPTLLLPEFWGDITNY